MGRIYDATWGRAFSAIYDPMLRAAEENGLREMRRRTLATASGRTVDVGAGTGANLGLFPEAVTELILSEPDPHMAKRLRARVAVGGVDAEIATAGAERLPYEDDSVDTVVFTLVLCTIPDPAAALAEAARVLKPGGKALFVEHVRSTDPRSARWQDRLERPWRLFGDGCRCNRDTLATIAASPLRVESVERTEMPKSIPITRPMIYGTAVAA